MTRAEMKDLSNRLYNRGVEVGVKHLIESFPSITEEGRDLIDAADILRGLTSFPHPGPRDEGACPRCNWKFDEPTREEKASSWRPINSAPHQRTVCLLYKHGWAVGEWNRGAWKIVSVIEGKPEGEPTHYTEMPREMT